MKQNRVEQWVKRSFRELEARFNPLSVSLTYRGVDLKLQRSLFWQTDLVGEFLREITPYHDAINRTCLKPNIFVDAGAAEGHFTVSTALLFPGAKVYAFEPSARQRIMLQRNAVRNSVTTQVEIVPKGLFNQNGNLAFRTAGAASFLEVVEDSPSFPPCFEQVPVIRLDDWKESAQIPKIDVIKMDIEGAEIEALVGAEQTLKDFRPVCLIQAYHIRDRARTFEQCAKFFNNLDFKVLEFPTESGMIFAHPLDI